MTERSLLHEPASSFKIGCEFRCGDKTWRCTDVGTRTVIAVCLDDHRDDMGWYNGPPYTVLEHVFDEDDQRGCEIIAGATVIY